MLNCYKENADQSFKSQIDFVINQLSLNTDSREQSNDDTISEDGEDVDDFDTDEDENDEPTFLNEENDELILGDQEMFGPELLYSLFSTSNDSATIQYNIPAKKKSKTKLPPPRPTSRCRPKTPFDQVQPTVSHIVHSFALAFSISVCPGCLSIADKL